MAGFRKAKAGQAYLKVGMYGMPGSGKTFTSLLIAEGLAKATGKRIAYVDTERGTDFYCQAVEGRPVHPEAFDFDALYTKSLTEVISSCKALKPDEYSVIVIDSVTHLWEAAKLAYTGSRTRADTIPIYAWQKIKKPYKDLMAWLINAPFHVFILGRQANEMEEDETTGETRTVGVKMSAEKETPYEPHLCVRMEAIRSRKGAQAAIPSAFIEKDRTGLLNGKVIQWPNFESVAKPILPFLGLSQTPVQTDDEAARVDADVISQQERDRERFSVTYRNNFESRFRLAISEADLEAIGKELTPDLKAKMVNDDIQHLKKVYGDLLMEFRGRSAAAEFAA